MKFKKRIITSILVVIVVIVLGLIFACGAVFSNHSYTLKTYTALDAADKIKDAQKSGGTIALNRDEINELLQIYLKKGIAKGDFTLKGLNVDIQNDKMIFYAPISYKGIEFLLSAKGTINIEPGKDFIFSADYFRIGSLPVPKVAVFTIINKTKNSNVSVKNNDIYIDGKIVPFDIDKFEVKNNNVYMYVEKFIPKGLFENNVTILNNAKDELEKLKDKAKSSGDKQKIESIIDNIDKAVKNPQSATSDEMDKIKSELGDIQKGLEGTQDNNTVKNIQNEINKTSDAKKKQDLSKVSGELNAAASALSNPTQKQIISMMQGTIGRLSANPSYNYQGDAASVRALYNTLSASDKKAFKAAVLSNVDPSTVIDLRNAFGI